MKCLNRDVRVGECAALKKCGNVGPLYLIWGYFRCERCTIQALHRREYLPNFGEDGHIKRYADIDEPSWRRPGPDPLPRMVQVPMPMFHHHVLTPSEAEDLVRYNKWQESMVAFNDPSIRRLTS